MLRTLPYGFEAPGSARTPPQERITAGGRRCPWQGPPELASGLASGLSSRLTSEPKGLGKKKVGGERAGNRTPNLVIKSHLLCQLSYAPRPTLELSVSEFKS